MEEEIIIEGDIPLTGEVNISGAKNSALVIIAAALLSRGNVYLDNVPNLTDITTIIKLLKYIGADVSFENNSCFINAKNINENVAPYDLVSTMRASFFTLGPLLARFGEVKMPLPGGCAIGSRPVDIHLKGFKALGADVEIENGLAIVKANKLVGAKIYLDFPSVGATENILMAATYAKGTTVIENVAREPEVVDLANFLNSMGAKIIGAGTPTIFVEGVENLGDTNYKIMSDRIEAGSFMIAGAASGGDIIVNNAEEKVLHSLISKMVEVGVKVDVLSPERIRVVGKGCHLKAVNLKTLPYPGFFTDLQSPMVSLLTKAEGTSIVHETVFENRFMYVDELNRMGADIRIESNFAIIKGVDKLSGAPVRATDLRAAAALAISAFSAEGETIISGLEHLDRGYERFTAKCSSLGAKIKRIPMEKPLVQATK